MNYCNLYMICTLFESAIFKYVYVVIKAIVYVCESLSMCLH